MIIEDQSSKVRQDRVRGVVSGDATHLAAGVLARAAKVEPTQRRAVGGQLGEGTVPEEVLAPVLDVPDAPVSQAVLALEVCRGPQRVLADRPPKVRGVAGDLVDQ